MNEDYLIKVRNFAIDNHRRVNQLYDGLPYHIHLVGVVDFSYRFQYLLNEDEIIKAIATAWLHDVIEDTGLTFNDVKKVTGEEVAGLVCNLTTNIHGKNRKERADDDYYERVSSDKISIFVKIADRLANIFHSYHYGNDSMYKKYKKELPEFKEKLYTEDFKDMWDLFEDIEDLNINDNEYYPDINRFDGDSVHRIKLPNPIPYNLFKELYNKGIIPKKELRKNTYYKGKCRNASVALWNGFEFVYMRYKFGYYIDSINHLEDDNGYDLFIPYEIEKNPTENQRIKY